MILQVTGYQRGEFPFRYLGMPIPARELLKANCDIIVDKMLKRILFGAQGIFLCY